MTPPPDDPLDTLRAELTELRARHRRAQQNGLLRDVAADAPVTVDEVLDLADRAVTVACLLSDQLDRAPEMVRLLDAKNEKLTQELVADLRTEIAGLHRREAAGRKGGLGRSVLTAAQQQAIPAIAADLRRIVPYSRRGSTRWLARMVAAEMGLDAEVVRRALRAARLQ